ncbi:MAG: hypothetical protein WCB92_12190, partial [Mycobacterium sp.]
MPPSEFSASRILRCRCTAPGQIEAGTWSTPPLPRPAVADPRRQEVGVGPKAGYAVNPLIPFKPNSSPAAPPVPG